MTVLPRLVRLAFLLLLLGCGLSCRPTLPAASSGDRVVRCAVIGGMTMTGLWPEIAREFEAATGWRAAVSVTGPRPDLARAARAGQVDWITMHASDLSAALEMEGVVLRPRPWAQNELCVVGPPGDPAGIRGLTNGAVALRRIHDRGARLVDFQGGGSRELVQALWRAAELEPDAGWVLPDESETKWDILQFARCHGAYVVVGHIPVRSGRMPAAGMEVLVKDDPEMRRTFVVMETNPERFPGIRHAGARALSDFLVSRRGQELLSRLATRSDGPGAQFFPLGTPHP